MKRNSRLSLALHALSHMAYDMENAQTSADIADHAGTNPVVVRRVLGKLRAAGLLTSERGHSGGWRLARDTRHITLADVYAALGESLIASDPGPETNVCAVERALDNRVLRIMKEIEDSLVARLSQTTIADVQRSIRQDASHAH
ncbi:MAG: Rrf2 family transcriptional regulator [Pseudomonadota bacterium]